MPGPSRISLPIIKDATTVGASAATQLYGYDADEFTVQATVTGTGAVTAVVAIEVSNDGVGWINDSTSILTLSGNNVASQGFVILAPWKQVRANITSISGTNAKVNVTLGG